MPGPARGRGEDDRPLADLPLRVGSRVRELRQRRDLTLSELARRAGLGKGTLSELESGQRNPTLETLYALSTPLGVGLADLVAYAEPISAVALSGTNASTVLLDVIRTDAVSTEVHRLRIEPGPARVSPGHGSGVREQLTVITGRVRAGLIDQLDTAGPGETISWQSHSEHSYQTLTDEPAVGILLITHPINWSAG